MHFIRIAAQVIIALGIFNVWILRYNKSTTYRGGAALTMRQEFAAYGLPFWAMCVIGGLKITLAIALLVGIWVPVLVLPAACAMAVLMIGAIVMHLKVSDGPRKSLPAACMLLLSILVAVL